MTKKVFFNSKLYSSSAIEGTSITLNKHTSKFVVLHFFGKNLTKCAKIQRYPDYVSTTSKLAINSKLDQPEWLIMIMCFEIACLFSFLFSLLLTIPALNWFPFDELLQGIWWEADHLEGLLPNKLRCFEVVCFFRGIHRITVVVDASTNRPVFRLQRLAVFRNLGIRCCKQCTSWTQLQES